MKTNLKFIIIIIVTIVITCAGFIIYVSTNQVYVINEESKEEPHRRTARSYTITQMLIDRLKDKKSRIIKYIKRIMMLNDSSLSNSMPDNLDEFISQYKSNPDIKLPEKFTNWENDAGKTISLCHFGICLLQKSETEKDNVYNKIAGSIVKMITEKFNDISKLHTTDLSTQKSSSWIQISINLMRFLVTYEYVGNDDVIKKFIHDLIKIIIPAIDYAPKSGFTDIYILQFTMTRLLTNYLYDYDTFEKDFRFIIHEKSISTLNIAMNESDNVIKGVYKDGSCISMSSIPNYRYLQRYIRSSNFQFYQRICRVLAIKAGNLQRIVAKISRRLCHPQSPHVPFGMFDAEGYTVRTNWWDIDGVNGTFILPFIGLGIFKTKNVMFSVRVQRPFIAACQLDSNKTGGFIIGSIQLRRIYLTRRQYPRKLEWEELVYEPGIISIANTTMLPLSFLKESNLRSDSYSCDDIDPNNFVARLSDSGGILIWFNKYKCTMIHSTVTEVGLFTNNGLESCYIIHNHGPNQVQFCSEDKSSAPSLLNTKHGRQLSYTSVPSSVDGFVILPPGEPKSLSWRVVFDTKKKTNISYDNERKMISFIYESYSYKVFIKDDSRYIIERNDGKVVAGSSSSLPNHSMEIDGKIFVRNSTTFMYS